MKIADAARICAGLERGVEAHYRSFAKEWSEEPEIETFWREMADAEHLHGDILEAAVEYFEGDALTVPVDREQLEWARGVIEGARHWTRSHDLEKALECALVLEQLEVDEIYEKVVRAAGTAFHQVSRSIVLSLEELAGHEEALAAMI